MCTSISERNDVVYFINRNRYPLFKALLAKRVCLDVGVAYPFPGSSVSTTYSRVPVVLLVSSGLFLFMLLAIPIMC